MALRKTQDDQLVVVPAPDVRLSRLPDLPARSLFRTPGHRPWDSFFARVLAGSLLVSLPVVAVLGLLTFDQGVKTSTDAATARTQATAEATAIRIGAWLGERKAELRQKMSQYGLGTVTRRLLQHALDYWDQQKAAA